MAYLTNNLEKIILYVLVFGICLQRLSTAIGNVGYVLAIVLFLYWCYKNRNLVQTRVAARIDMKLCKYYALFLLCFLPSVIFSGTFLASSKQLLEMFVFRMVPFAIVMLVASNNALLERMLLVVFGVEILDCGVAFYQSIFLGMERAEGFGMNSLNLAGLLAMLIPLVAIIVLDNSYTGRLKQVAYLALPVFLACGFAANRSRALWVITIIISVLLLLKYRHSILKNKKLVSVILIIVAVGGGWFLSSEKNLRRIATVTNTTTDTSNVARLYMWRSCVKIMEDYPLTGTGLGNYKDLYNQQYELATIPVKGFGHPHNSYLHLGAQAGVPGFLAITVATIGIISWCFKKWLSYKNVCFYILGLLWVGFSLFGMIEPIIDSTVHVKFLSFLSAVLIMQHHLADDKFELASESEKSEAVD